jgi:hypothetical protein
MLNHVWNLSLMIDIAICLLLSVLDVHFTSFLCRNKSGD